VVRLLPGFDMWAIGAARDAAALLDPAEKKRVYAIRDGFRRSCS
jgi:hypothetical protein